MAEYNSDLVAGTQFIEGSVLPFLLRHPGEAIAGPIPALIMMHGRGANEGDVFELVSYANRVLVVAPRAPLLNSDDPRGSFKWYELSQPGQNSTEGEGMQPSLETMLRFIQKLDENVGEKPDPNKLVIGGFSQGAAMSLALIAARPDLFAGAIIHSSPFSPELSERLRQADLRGKPFFVAHGTQDFLNIDEHAEKLVSQLKEQGANVSYHTYPIAHETSEQSRRDLAEWHSKLLALNS